jgi:glycosyltransferase involved in cell wall biosynthesis
MAEPFHVLHIAEDFLTPGKDAGGAPISIRSQIVELAKTCRVTVLAPRIVLPPLSRYRRGPSGVRQPQTNASANTMPAGVRVFQPRYLHVPLFWPVTEPIQLLLITLWFLFHQAREARLLHGHRAYPMGVAAVMAAKLSGKTSVVTAHGSDVHTQAVSGDWRVRLWIRWALRQANMVIPVSLELFEILGSLGVKAPRRHYIPNGVDVGRFRIGIRDEARGRLGMSDTGSHLLSVALFVPIKGHAILVEAFATLAQRHSDLRLTMIGDGPLLETIQEQVSKCGLRDRVTFTGTVDYSEVPVWMSAADVFVLPSYNEGTPLAALEALASRRRERVRHRGGTGRCRGACRCTGERTGEELGSRATPGPSP